MTGAEMFRLRHDLGEAVGRKISTGDMARICGLAPKNGADKIRKWEEGEGPSGPVATLLSILAYASERHIPPRDFLEPFHFIKMTSGPSMQVGPEVAEPLLRHYMRAEILRRLS